MVAAGMSLTDALAFWNKMMNSPNREAIDWWHEMRKAVGARVQ
jgi:hypothetical protein